MGWTRFWTMKGKTSTTSWTPWEWISKQNGQRETPKPEMSHRRRNLPTSNFKGGLVSNNAEKQYISTSKKYWIWRITRHPAFSLLHWEAPKTNHARVFKCVAKLTSLVYNPAHYFEHSGGIKAFWNSWKWTAKPVLILRGPNGKPQFLRTFLAVIFCALDAKLADLLQTRKCPRVGRETYVRRRLASHSE